jgi:hypothetical protein
VVQLRKIHPKGIAPECFNFSGKRGRIFLEKVFFVNKKLRAAVPVRVEPGLRK